MTHEDALIAKLLGKLHLAEADAHLSGCPRCASEIMSLEALETKVRAAAPPLHPVGRPFVLGVLARLPGRAAGRRLVMAAAAAMVIAAGAGMAWMTRECGMPHHVPVPGGNVSQAAASWWPEPEDSTAELLKSIELPAVPEGGAPEEGLLPYLNPEEGV